jgi:hypothetical protein
LSAISVHLLARGQGEDELDALLVPLEQRVAGARREAWMSAIEPDASTSLWLDSHRALVGVGHFDTSSFIVSVVLPPPPRLVDNYVAEDGNTATLHSALRIPGGFSGAFGAARRSLPEGLRRIRPAP